MVKRVKKRNDQYVIGEVKKKNPDNLKAKAKPKIKAEYGEFKIKPDMWFKPDYIAERPKEIVPRGVKIGDMEIEMNLGNDIDIQRQIEAMNQFERERERAIQDIEKQRLIELIE